MTPHRTSSFRTTSSASRLPIAFSAGAILTLALWTASSAASPQRVGEDIFVNDPRPIDAAVQEFQHRCRCVVTYEDPRWQADDVEDISNVRQRPAGAPRIKVPNGHTFIAPMRSSLDAAGLDERRIAIEEILRAGRAAGNTKEFRVISGKEVLHVVPASNAVLNSPVSLPSGDRTLGQMVSAILQQVSAETGEKVTVGAVPVNLFRQGKLPKFSADRESARDVLVRGFSLGAPTVKLSWQLLFDYSTETYYFSVSIVN